MTDDEFEAVGRFIWACCLSILAMPWVLVIAFVIHEVILA